MKAIASLLVAVSTTGCGATQYENVRPWFRIGTTERHVIAPHALEFGGARRAETLIDRDWRELPHGRRSDFRVEVVGDTVVLEEYGKDPEHSGVFLYHEGELAPAHLGTRECPSPEISEQPAEVTCFGCGTRAPGTKLGEGECTTLQIASYDLRGRLKRRRAIASTIQLPEIEGRLPSGAWIVAETRPNPDFLFLYGPRSRHQLDERGLVPLPYGSDPLRHERDAEERASEVLRLQPLRDAAVAEMKAAFAEEERAHPERTLLEGFENQLRAGLSMEPDVKTKPDTCYLAIVRTTPDLERIQLSVARDYLDLGRSVSHASDPPLARVSGSEVTRLSRCIAPNVASEPEALRFRIDAKAGKGFIAVRIYAFPRASLSSESEGR